MIEQIKSDHEKGQWITQEDAEALWDLFSDPRFPQGKERFCRRIARLPELEEAYIAAIEALKSANGFVLISDHATSNRVLAEVEAVLANAKGATA